MEFELDEEKRRSVLDKHGVDLAYLARMFNTPEDMSVWPDIRNETEPRWIAIGRIDGQWYELSFVIRGTAIRLITGWKLNEKTRRKAEARHARRNQRHV